MDSQAWPDLFDSLAVQNTDLQLLGASMEAILSGEASPTQIAGLLMGLKCKGEDERDLVVMLESMASHMVRVELGDELRAKAIDTCGTGGDRSHSINVSTLGALVAAGAGAKVCKHGNRSASSSCGSADLLEALGVTLTSEPAVVARCVEGAGIGFCFAPAFHPALRHVGAVRRELGVRTAFNFLGPLSNPSGLSRQVVGVPDQALARLLASVLARRGAAKALVVCGDAGVDEITLSGPTLAFRVVGTEVSQMSIDPGDLGFAHAPLDAIRGGDVEHNAKLAREVLDGAQGPHRDVVVLNAAAALWVADLCESLPEGVGVASDAIDSGRAARALDALVALS